jgi:hypothetical protein
VTGRWRPVWEERDLEEGLRDEKPSPQIADVSGHREWTREAARFAIVFGLLLDVEGSPLRQEAAPRKKSARRAAERRGEAGWVTRYVHLEDDARRRLDAAEAEAARTAGATGTADRALLPVQVLGHMRRQRHGPGHREVKWIDVAGHAARRWVALGPHRVVVDNK